ncbi:DUF4083 domain-containing protein [Cytobacillus dafuensis]|uniref:DUF4083 domain-containing protein n=1 Tax=Cytobacillus dafuensis TaxID=1742359 RepID=A0A5B8Z529_CYTDA|nr:DUF4083 domain-containing protein [Cytobacillus dafuensis]QED48008.1 DUF4083 domain-containing protein [Cytobacillus dafuensis]
MYMASSLFLALIISLLLLGAVSFTLFIRRLLINSKVNYSTSDDINKKLDKIIELLEKQSK